MRFLLYLFRWQLSSPILLACLLVMTERIGVFWATVVSNLLGGIIFYFVDKRILNVDRYSK